MVSQAKLCLSALPLNSHEIKILTLPGLEFLALHTIELTAVFNGFQISVFAAGLKQSAALRRARGFCIINSSVQAHSLLHLFFSLFNE